MTPLSPNSMVGILGGGQLGRMLALAAARLGYRVAILDPDKSAPAAQVANIHIAAAYEDESALDELAALADVVTFEWENVPVASARRIEERTPVFPPPSALEAAQDRLSEKRFLNEHGIQTAPFHTVDSDQDAQDALFELGGTGIIKTRRMGYDGKGQLRLRGSDDLAGLHASFKNVPLILEGIVPFEREISVIAARGQDGSFLAFDPAENVHRDGILHTSTVPANITPQVAHEAKEAARKILDALDYVGVIGVEFFVTHDDRLLANEIAPRVHNSGHWTEAACVLSQFEAHIRALVGLPLPDAFRHSDCVMENLIGDEVNAAPALAAEPGAMVHLYGKAEARPGRKMGHVTRLTPLLG